MDNANDYCNLVIPSKSLQLRKNRRYHVGKNLVEIYNTSSTYLGEIKSDPRDVIPFRDIYK